MKFKKRKMFTVIAACILLAAACKIGDNDRIEEIQSINNNKQNPNPDPDKSNPPTPNPDPDKPNPPTPNPDPDKPNPPTPNPDPDKPKPPTPNPDPDKPNPPTPNPDPDKPNPPTPNPDPDKPDYEAADKDNPYLTGINIIYFSNKGEETKVQVNDFDKTKTNFYIEKAAELPRIKIELQTKAKEVAHIKFANMSASEISHEAIKVGDNFYKSQFMALAGGENLIKISVMSSGKKYGRIYNINIKSKEVQPSLQPTKKVLGGMSCPAPGKEELVWVICGHGG